MHARTYVHSRAASSGVCYSVVPILGLKIYGLGYGVHGGHMKLQNRPLLHPGLFPFHGWHFTFYLLSLFCSIFPPPLSLPWLFSLIKTGIDHLSSVLDFPTLSLVFFVFFLSSMSLVCHSWQSETVSCILGCLNPVSGSFHVILLALQSKNSWRSLTCGFRLKNSPNKHDCGARKSKTGRLFCPVSSLIANYETHHLKLLSQSFYLHLVRGAMKALQQWSQVRSG